MKVLVIGGSRFIGLHLVLGLVTGEHDVTVVNDEEPRIEYSGSVRYYRGDRRDAALLERWVSDDRFDVVFDMCAEEPSDLEITMRALNTRVIQYIYCSSISAYNFKEIPCFPIGEDSPVKADPTSADEEVRYGSKRALCEKMLLGSGTFVTTVVRPTYVYGPHAYDNRLEFFLDRIMDDRPILVPRLGDTVAHFVHVYDLVAMFLSCMGNPQAYGQIYNAAGHEATTFNGLIRICEDLIGRRAAVRVCDLDTLSRLLTRQELSRFLPARVYPFSMYFSTAKAQSELGWRPTLSLLDGLRLTYSWYKDNRKEVDYSLDNRVLAFLGADPWEACSQLAK